MSELTTANITKGTYIWYSGKTATSQWSCPAVITRVDDDAKVFYVKSLDDMMEQSQKYEFEVTKQSSWSRRSMRLATLDEVGVYLDKQEESLIEKVSMTRRVRHSASLTLHRFREEREKLFPDHLKK